MFANILTKTRINFLCKYVNLLKKKEILRLFTIRFHNLAEKNYGLVNFNLHNENIKKKVL